MVRVPQVFYFIRACGVSYSNAITPIIRAHGSVYCRRKIRTGSNSFLDGIKWLRCVPYQRVYRMTTIIFADLENQAKRLGVFNQTNVVVTTLSTMVTILAVNDFATLVAYVNSLYLYVRWSLRFFCVTLFLGE